MQEIGSPGGTRATCMEFQVLFLTMAAYNALCAALDKEDKVRGVATYHTKTSERVRGSPGGTRATCMEFQARPSCVLLPRSPDSRGSSPRLGARR